MTNYVASYKRLIAHHFPGPLQILDHPSVRHHKISSDEARYLAARMPNVEPKPHQQIVRQHMRSASGLLVVHGTGTGKTLTASFVAKDFLSTHKNGMVVVVSPPGVISQFFAEVGTVVDPKDMNRVYAFGFQKLASVLQSQYGGLVKTKVSAYPTLLVIDEVHYLNNYESAMTSTIFDLALRVTKVMAMSATPITNKVRELSTLLAFVRQDKELMGMDFKVSPTDGSITSLGKQVTDAQFDNMVRCYVSVHHSDLSTNTNYPELVEHPPIFLELPKNSYVNAIMDERTYSHRKQYANERVKLMAQDPKLQTTLQLMDAHPGKTILYVEMKKNVERVERFLELHRIRYDKIVGDTDPRMRPNMVRRFSDPNSAIQVMILSKAGMAGLDFKRVKNLIFLELPWNYADYQQIVGRAVRYKSHPENKPRGRVNVFIPMYTAPSNSRHVFNQAAYAALLKKKMNTSGVMSRILPLTIEKSACFPSERRITRSIGNFLLRRRKAPPSPTPQALSPVADATSVSQTTKNAVRSSMKNWWLKTMPLQPNPNFMAEYAVQKRRGLQRSHTFPSLSSIGSYLRRASAPGKVAGMNDGSRGGRNRRGPRTQNKAMMPAPSVHVMETRSRRRPREGNAGKAGAFKEKEKSAMPQYG